MSDDGWQQLEFWAEFDLMPEWVEELFDQQTLMFLDISPKSD
jgi:hypothetical protein